jgi:outer membrane protein assembly factor BamA
MLFEESDGSIDGLIGTSPGAGCLNHLGKLSQENLFGRGDGVAKRVEVGEHSSRTLGKSWVLQNCDLDDDLRKYVHTNSNR